jgi:two-component system phosphate regulon sensor histidine kinase PhoR
LEPSDRTYSILIVDDERNLRDGSERILLRYGHQVDQASKGEDALVILKENPADIVLLDLKMPGMDGMEVLDHIRANYPATLVIIVTGFATIETAIDAMKKGAYDFMTKPFRPDQLRLVVERAIEHIRLREERDRLSAERARGLRVITTEKGRLKTVVNAIVAGILVTELDKHVVLSNPALGRMMDVDPEAITGTHMESPALEPLREMFDDLLAGEYGPDDSLTREIESPGGRPISLRATAQTVASENDEIIGLVVVVRDITQQKELEKEKSAFVAMLTHELRSPLSAVDTQFHVVLKGLAGDLSEKQRDMFTRMKNRINNVLLMINDLLDLSKIEARQFSEAKSPTNMGPVVEECVDLLRAQAVEKKLEIASRCSQDLPLVMADINRIRDVITNLISNAIRYTAVGRVDIDAEAKDGFVVIKVSDTGLGIAPQYHDKVFDRFFRVKDQRARNVVGTGLGLPIVKAIVEDHQGTVELDSEIDRGSTFIVKLPISEPGETGQS